MDNEAAGSAKFNIYAVITRRADLKISSEALREAEPNSNNTRHLGYQPVEPGSLVKVFQTPRENESKKYIVQVLDLLRHDLIYENLYECPEQYVMTISAELWPFVISVRQEYRLKLINNKEHCQWLTYLKLKDFVSVNGELFKKPGTRYDCIIRYIGPVQELKSVGYFFGLELLHIDQGYSPQSEDIPFSIKYIECDPSLSIFTTAEWITPISSDVNKKFSARQLITDTFGKVCTAIVPAGSGLGSTTSSTQRRDKKLKPKMATAQFYDDRTPKKETTGVVDNKTTEPKVFGIVPSENEDFKQSVENYEKTVERQYRLHGTTDKTMPTGTNTLQQQPATVGILKHRRTQSTSGGSKERESGGVKIQSTIMSLSDRDLVVIDKADIRESTKDETNVIVVDKPISDNVDLADLLGSNWPKQAGGAAGILNKSQTVAGAEAEQDVEMRDCSQTATPATTLTTTTTHDDELALNRINNTTTNGINLEPPLLDVEIKQLQEVDGLSVGSLVEILVPETNDDLFGVIRWIGLPPGAVDVLVGVELEEEQMIKTLQTTDGSYNGYRLFQCPEGRAVFVSPELCAIDRRFIDTTESAAGGSKISCESQMDAKMFGHVDCPPIAGAVPPLKIYGFEDLDGICGKFKGIQGHHNSCYLDATLFAMFTFTSVFDSLLYRSPDAEDIAHYTEVQKVLREEIVNPLRKNAFVRADRVMKLRKLLDQLSSVSGLTSEEKDPEEFLNSLLAQIMRVDPFLKLSSGQDSYFYQLFVEKDERLTFPTVQQLFEQSFHSSDIKLKEVPSCLIIQMPRFGKNYKMYPRILPSQVLDVTDIIEDSPRQCSVCGKLAEYECRECFGSLQGGAGLESTAFCQKCLNTVHMHSKRTNHTSRKLTVPKDFKIMAEHMIVPRLYMELFAVVCIETSHYVAFVKAGCGPDAPWCFFDSMADRKGEKNGYNIPEVISVRELTEWLSEDGARAVNETSTNDKVLPEHAKRLFCDAYMCMYQSTDVMMYR